jgi:hypothetical protein
MGIGMEPAIDTSEGDPPLSVLLPRVVLRAPFLSKELGPLRYLSAHHGGVLVAVFSNGFSLHLHGDVRAMAVAFARLAETTTR